MIRIYESCAWERAGFFLFFWIETLIIMIEAFGFYVTQREKEETQRFTEREGCWNRKSNLKMIGGKKCYFYGCKKLYCGVAGRHWIIRTSRMLARAGIESKIQFRFWQHPIRTTKRLYKLLLWTWNINNWIRKKTTKCRPEKTLTHNVLTRNKQ